MSYFFKIRMMRSQKKQSLRMMRNRRRKLVLNLVTVENILKIYFYSFKKISGSIQYYFWLKNSDDEDEKVEKKAKIDSDSDDDDNDAEKKRIFGEDSGSEDEKEGESTSNVLQDDEPGESQ